MKKTSFCFRTGWKLQFGVANPDRDDMSVSGDFQQFEQKAGLDRHVIPNVINLRKRLQFIAFLTECFLLQSSVV
ncbi:MAG: hypothetical protein LBQ01_09615 [Prevotellaceae bacterium]|nr:hypothetical protein [Prevotellaceae bacterium]